MGTEYVNYCHHCRAEQPDGQRTCEDCGWALDLARNTVTYLDTSSVDMAKITADIRKERGLSVDELPDDWCSFDSLSCSSHEVVDSDATRPL